MAMTIDRPAEPLLTVAEVARRLDVSEESVRRWLRSGELRGIRFARKAGWRIRSRDLEAFIEQRTNAPAQE